jgi:hypothetical protein
MGRREALAAKVVFAALGQLAQNNGSLDLATLRTRIEANTQFDAWESTVLPHGKTRWCSALERYSHEYVKANLISKNRGQWTLTVNGRFALHGDPMTTFGSARRAYQTWQASKQSI